MLNDLGNKDAIGRGALSSEYMNRTDLIGSNLGLRKVKLIQSVLFD
jgi:hypothetical protein